ncbi:hypothetical protein COCCADRAFT_98869 [Bipolaris zeicola 26-R-13]|uniref:Uncharacterized protein n=1 Tax=Cochliobolus carbonum (strain 26-R-13) TaxID=930089 RepID=W6YLX0_COCC2|nr:uncharacterized protein COCCADRAFT_98869 [Bipolaris zeicola 26-R-13]EUC32381.1 hypothetical protein COCCADRAFT_98869 [Bipolaris zeicola 26-R-13]
MVGQTKNCEMKQKMQVLKDLYLSRHYTRCAKSGERLLGEVDSSMHPVHLAYLNFYTALSHDTLAREATIKNRHHELVAAEEYYRAAIAALSLPSSTCSTPTLDDEHPSTPESATFPEEHVWLDRLKTKSSNLSTSCRTSSSSTMSDPFDLEKDIYFELKGFSFPSPPRTSTPTFLEVTSNPRSSHIDNSSMLSPLSTHPVRPEPVAKVHFPLGTSTFVGMLQGHLTSVLTLKESTGAHDSKFTFPNPSASPTKSQLKFPRTSDLPQHQKEELRNKRKQMAWRPRFDPGSIRKLCDEALAEL